MSLWDGLRSMCKESATKLARNGRMREHFHDFANDLNPATWDFQKDEKNKEDMDK